MDEDNFSQQEKFLSGYISIFFRVNCGHVLMGAVPNWLTAPTGRIVGPPDGVGGKSSLRSTDTTYAEGYAQYCNNLGEQRCARWNLTRRQRQG